LKKIAAALARLAAIPTNDLGGRRSAVTTMQSSNDYRGVFWISDKPSPFQVMPSRPSLPTIGYDDVARQLLPRMQIATAAAPTSPVTYDKPLEMPVPEYRIY